MVDMDAHTSRRSWPAGARPLERNPLLCLDELIPEPPHQPSFGECRALLLVALQALVQVQQLALATMSKVVSANVYSGEPCVAGAMPMGDPRYAAPQAQSTDASKTNHNMTNLDCKTDPENASNSECMTHNESENNLWEHAPALEKSVSFEAGNHALALVADPEPDLEERQSHEVTVPRLPGE